MTISVGQKPMGRQFDGTSASIQYVAVCSAGESEADVVAAIEADAPTSYTGLARQPLKATEINVSGDGAPSVWDVEVPYGRSGARLIPPTNTVTWSGTTTGGHENTTVGREAGTPFTDPSVTTLPVNWGQAIGATKDDIKGVEITLPVYSVRAVRYAAASDINDLRIAAFALTGTTNAATFYADGQPFAEGEVLFLGMTWAKRIDVVPNDYECTFEFAMSPNASSLTIGGIIDIVKAGWDYLDVTHEDREEGGFSLKVPIIATVFRMYEPGDFSLLGLS